MILHLMNKLEQAGFTQINLSQSLDLWGNDDALINYTYNGRRLTIYQSSLKNLLKVDSDPSPEKLLKISF